MSSPEIPTFNHVQTLDEFVSSLKKEKSFTAHIRKIRFANKGSHFYIAELQVGDYVFTGKFKSFVEVVSGLEFECKGTWGAFKGKPQFNGTSMRPSVPTDPTNLTMWLGHYTKGISHRDVTAWTEALPEQATLLSLDEDELRGIGVPDYAVKELLKLNQHFHQMECLAQLNEWGLDDRAIELIMEELGSNPIQAIRENPYQLVHFNDVTFENADVIGKELNFAKDDPRRIGAGMYDIMRWHEGDGHAYYPADETVADGMRLLGIRGQTIIDAIKSKAVTDVVLEDRRLYSDSVYHAESKLTNILAERIVESDTWLTISDEEILEIGREVTGLDLTDDQVQAVQGMFKSRFSILVGGAGTGKTVVEATITGIIERKHMDVHIVAPTGKAAKRAEEVSGLHAETVHAAFGFTGHNWGINEQNPMEDVDVLSLDEFSMLTTDMAYRVVSGVPKSIPILMFGDHNQLEAIGTGKIAYALTHSKDVNVQRLTEVKRTVSNDADGHENGLNDNAYRILARKELKPNDDVHVHVCPSSEQRVALLLDKVKETQCSLLESGKQLDLVRDIQVLTPMNKGDLGVHALNPKLREICNPAAARVQAQMDLEEKKGKNPIFPDDVFPCYEGRFFMRGDKIMKMRDNNKKSDLYNGDVGIVLQSDQEKCKVKIGKRIVTLKRDELKTFDLAYAMTIHKSQGSEYKHVLAVMDSSQSRMFSNNLMYTMATRGKESFTVIHDGKAIDQAINTDPAPRYCTFGQRLEHKVYLLRQALLMKDERKPEVDEPEDEDVMQPAMG